MSSLCLLGRGRAGFPVCRCERLREPSDKLTLVAFLRLPARGAVDTSEPNLLAAGAVGGAPQGGVDHRA